jgi:hypothetical protein
MTNCCLCFECVDTVEEIEVGLPDHKMKVFVCPVCKADPDAALEALQMRQTPDILPQGDYGFRGSW